MVDRLGDIQTSVPPFTTRSGGPDTAQQGGKGGAGGKVPDSGGSSPGAGFPLPHNLLDEHDAEVCGLLCIILSFHTELLFTGPDSSSGSNATIKHAKYEEEKKYIK